MIIGHYEACGRCHQAMCSCEGHDDPWYSDEGEDSPGFGERALDLCDRHPERFVSHCTIWTPQRNEIEAVASHETLVGELLAVLVSMTEPRTDEQREAMQRLRDVLYGQRRPTPEGGEG